jgi:hypothetical protein
MPGRFVARLTGVDVSARKTYDLMDEPVGADYRALLLCAQSQCDTAVVAVDSERELGAEGRRLLNRLEPFAKAESTAGNVRILRIHLNRESVEVLGDAPGLFAWRQPERPENLCLLRVDGSPWMLSIAAERLGYLEFTPFEKLLLGRAAPGLAAVLAHQGAQDAILATFERRLETQFETVQADLVAYARTIVDEGREGLVAALRTWLSSDEHVRVAAAVSVVGRVEIVELKDEIAELLEALNNESLPVPAVYRSNFVLRERWKARFERQLRQTLETLTTE